MHLGSGIRDPGSGKNLFRIPDPGVKKAPDPGSRIRNTGHRNKKLILSCQRTFLQKKILPNISAICAPGSRVGSSNSKLMLIRIRNRDIKFCCCAGKAWAQEEGDAGCGDSTAENLSEEVWHLHILRGKFILRIILTPNRSGSFRWTLLR